MKKIDRMVEYKTTAGTIAEVEIKFADGSKATYKGIESRTGNRGAEIDRIDEWETPEGDMIELEITFTNNEVITYKGKITRKGTI
jgi:hypothetical protein